MPRRRRPPRLAATAPPRAGATGAEGACRVAAALPAWRPPRRRAPEPPDRRTRLRGQHAGGRLLGRRRRCRARPIDVPDCAASTLVVGYSAADAGVGRDRSTYPTAPHRCGQRAQVPVTGGAPAVRRGILIGPSVWTASPGTGDGWCACRPARDPDRPIGVDSEPPPRPPKAAGTSGAARLPPSPPSAAVTAAATEGGGHLRRRPAATIATIRRRHRRGHRRRPAPPPRRPPPFAQARPGHQPPAAARPGPAAPPSTAVRPSTTWASAARGRPSRPRRPAVQR